MFITGILVGIIMYTIVSAAIYLIDKFCCKKLNKKLKSAYRDGYEKGYNKGIEFERNGYIK